MTIVSCRLAVLLRNPTVASFTGFHNYSKYFQGGYINHTALLIPVLITSDLEGKVVINLFIWHSIPTTQKATNMFIGVGCFLSCDIQC